MLEPELEDKSEPGKLKRWVSNLQLESWQLELLITGFSIFLLVGGIDGYEVFRSEVQFNNIRPDSGAMNPILAVSILFLINSISVVLKFLLINLIIHLLLRGFWIGIVGLSSVSSVINYEQLNLKGNFKKFIPNKVRSLDGLIIYLDKISSVIFAYTYLLVFSIMSVVIVSSFILSLSGLLIWLAGELGDNAFKAIIIFILLVLVALMTIGAILFFIDTLLFSTFKKSKWFSAIYYPIYRLFSVLSLSILYRSIYYHLITNFKRKQIIVVALVLFGIFLMARGVSQWNSFKLFPDNKAISEFYSSRNDFDDTRSDAYINRVSLPSKFINNGFLELFIRYEAADNALLEFLCPVSEGLNRELSISDGFKAGVESQKDSTIDVSDLITGGDALASKIENSINCVSSIYELWIDGIQMNLSQFMYHMHNNKNEKGYLTVVDISTLGRGEHLLEIRKKVFSGVTFMQEIEADKISMRPFARLNFWVE